MNLRNLSKIWTNTIINNYEKGLNNLNKDFSKNNSRYKSNLNYSGIYVDKILKEGFFRIQKKNITFIQNENDSYILVNVHTNNNILKFLKIGI